MEKITLLNGVEWDVKECEAKMMDDDFYYKYLGQNALSSSIAKSLLDSPKTYHNYLRYGGEDTPAMLKGRMLHHMVLEPERWEDLYQVIEVKTRASKAFKEAEAESEKTCVTRSEMNATERMADALLRNKQVIAHLSGAQTEIPKIGMLNDLPFRCKADILVPDFGIFDLKTTADLRAFPYSAKKYGYPMQVYIYCTLFGLPTENFKFIVIDKTSCDIGIYDVDDSFVEMGRSMLEVATKNYFDFFGESATEDVDDYVITGTLRA